MMVSVGAKSCSELSQSGQGLKGYVAFHLQELGRVASARDGGPRKESPEVYTNKGCSKNICR